LWWRISCLFLGSLLVVVAPAAAAFEITGRGAQSTALGGAFAAGVKTAEAVWFNPAGNARLQKWRASTTHALLYPGLDQSPSLNGLAVAGPCRGGGLQAGLSFLNAEGWREQVAILGYGRALHPRLALGSGLRTSAWKAGDLSRRVWSLDLGGTYEVGFVHPRVYVRLGLIAKDLNAANIAAGGQASGETQRGVVIAASIGLEEQRVLIDVERRDGRTEVRAGYEVRTVSLGGARFRMGGSALSPGWTGKELNAGIGHNWKQWHFDYAYTYPLHFSGLGGVHRLSIGYRQR
jgi:hypothetical protein